MANKKTTIHDIARALDLNASTVSRALRNHPNVKEETRELVWAQARKLNYQPNQLASSLRRGKAHTIGVVVPRINRNFFAEVIHGIEQVAYDAGYQLLICQSIERYQREEKTLRALLAHRVDGILISLSQETQNITHLEALRQAQVPLVQFDRIAPGFPSPKVVNADRETGREIIDHLVSQGYRRIAFLGGPLTLNVYQNRYQGYLDGLAAHGLPLEPAWTSFDTLTEETARRQTHAWFTQPGAQPDAIFAAGDYSALGAVLALKELAVPIPETVGVVGYANEPFTPHMTPPLSTVDQRSEEMGRLAAELLLDVLHGANRDETCIDLKPKLLIRGSSSRKRYL